jgi:hypothetical protein
LGLASGNFDAVLGALAVVVVLAALGAHVVDDCGRMVGTADTKTRSDKQLEKAKQCGNETDATRK